MTGIKELGDSSPFFARLMKMYPAAGSKIDWRRIAGSIERVEENHSFQVDQFILFFDEVIKKFHLAGEVIYVGVSAASCNERERL